MDCRRIERSLTPFLDGELGPAEELAVRTHLGTCRRCAGRLETLRATRDAVAGLRPEPSDEGWAELERRLRILHRGNDPTAARAPDRRLPASRHRRWGLAAAVLLAALLAATATWIVDRPETPSPRSAEPTTHAEPALAPPGLEQRPCGSAEDCGTDARPLWPDFPL